MMNRRRSRTSGKSGDLFNGGLSNQSLGKKIMILQERRNHVTQLRTPKARIDNSLPWGYQNGSRSRKSKKKRLIRSRLPKMNKNNQSKNSKSKKSEEPLGNDMDQLELEEDERKMIEDLVSHLVKKKNLDSGNRVLNIMKKTFEEQILLGDYSGVPVLVRREQLEEEITEE